MLKELLTALQGHFDRMERLAAIQGRDTLTIKDAALLYGRDEDYFYRRTANREMPSYRRGGLVLLSKAELDSWFKTDRKQSEEEMRLEATGYVVRNRIKDRKTCKR